MPSGSRKDDFKPEQYERQLAHARAWKERNKERVAKYNREYSRKRRDRRSGAPEPAD